MFRLPCPRCDKSLWLDDSRFGREVTCPQCGKPFRVPKEIPKDEATPQPAQTPPEEAALRRLPKRDEPPFRPETEGKPAARASPVNPPPASSPAHRERPAANDAGVGPSARAADSSQPDRRVRGREEDCRVPPEKPKPSNERQSADADSSVEIDADLAEVVEEDNDCPASSASKRQEPAAEPMSGARPRAAGRDPLPKGKRRKKRRRNSAARELRGVLWAVVALGAMWLLLAPLAFFRHEGVYALLAIGGITLFCGKRWFLNVAAEDGLGTRLACAFIPFYSAYFFFTNLRRTIKPFAISCCGGAILVTGVMFWYVHKFRETVPEHVASSQNSDQDAECEKLLAKPNKAEARAWLTAENTRRGIFKWDRKEALRLVEELYRLGAKQVFVVEIASDPQLGELAAELLVVMPEAPEPRKKIFQWHGSFREEEADKDRGQKYLLVDLD